MDAAAIAASVLAAVDVERAVELTQAVCRVPSVLGEELALAELLADTMRRSQFENVELQPVLPNRPNSIGEMHFGAGPRVVLTGHMDTKPESIGWTLAEPYSGALIDGRVYGHGIMDMKAALACQIVAMEAVRRSGLPLKGTLAMAAVSDHMGDQLGSIRYFEDHRADLCVLGELSDNQIFLGHRGRYYFDITAEGRSAHTCHKHQAVNANALAARAILELEESRLEPKLDSDTADLFGAETMIVPGRVYGGLPPGGPSMIPDECVIRVDCRPQPGVSVETVSNEIDRCLASAKALDDRFKARVELVDVKSPYLANPEAVVVQTMIEAVRQVRGREPELMAAGWLGDTASFGGDIPTVIFGPGGEPVYCANESLPVADIEEATKVYAVFSALALVANK
ncbi:MAG: M20/M25/M40 family metallo-hydrolase [Acidimicrobiales bacterium]|nr:M20/M25/M40 family metallo-hydrolase [Acidimicrobiales bacterium]